MEVVHVELADEGVHVAVLEEEGKDLANELFLGLDLEALTVRHPSNDVLMHALVNNIEHFSQEHRYGGLFLISNFNFSVARSLLRFDTGIAYVGT